MKPSVFFKAPNVWTFWRFLLVQLHCSASLLPLAVFKKIHKFFEKPICFFETKNLNFLRFEKSFQFSCFLQPSCCRWLFLKNSRFISRNHFFSKESQVSNVLRYLTNSVAFYKKIANFGNFLRKSHFLFEKQNSATMLLLVILKKSRILSKIPSTFFQQKT